MKTDPSARCLLRIRWLVVCAALAALLGLELRVGEAMAARIGLAAASQTDGACTAHVGISDLMASAR